ncbi:hypothetical protein HZS_1950 [Henneguya salminicola]|nr:hypothetical protein HZS_1950 [Henneguya salminicola]
MYVIKKLIQAHTIDDDTLNLFQASSSKLSRNSSLSSLAGFTLSPTTFHTLNARILLFLTQMLHYFFIAQIFYLFRTEIIFDEIRSEGSGFVRRLPIHLYPVNYRIVLLTRLDQNHFQGLVEIEMISLSYNRKILLHQKDLKILRAELFQFENNEPAHRRFEFFNDDLIENGDSDHRLQIGLSNISYDTESETMAIFTQRDLQPNEKISLRLRYRAEYSKKLDGLYKMIYINSDHEKITIGSTQFEPTSARKVFPCFDEPSFKATFSLTIIHDSSLFSISNMPLQDGYPKNLTQYLTVSKFKTTIRMSTYLLSFSLIDFIHSNVVTSSGVVIRVYAPDTDINNLQYSTNIAARILTFYEEFFNEKYPLEKLDIVSMPEFMSGAMENPGHLIFRATNLIYDATRATVEVKKQIMMVISHELAHQNE